MRTTPWTILAVLALSFAAAACGDATLPAPSSEDAQTPAGEAGIGRTIILPPVTVTVPHCDPYTDLNFCQDDGEGGDCMTSAGAEDEFAAVMGCGPGDGGPGGGKAGGLGGPGGVPDPPTECTTSDCVDVDTDLSMDMARDTIPPDCRASDLTVWQEVYCTSTIDADQARKTQQALDRIAQRGAECALIAQRGRELLAAGEIRFYLWTNERATGYGHANTGIQLAEQLLDRYDPLAPDQDFEHVLVHELDHVFRRDHIDGDGWNTPSTALCG